MSRFKNACTASRGERVLRVVIALFVGAFALASVDTPLVAIIGAMTALYLLFLAVTGWCPGSAADPFAVDLVRPEDEQ